ncbi:APC family permease [Ktedonobacter racemifer]|uniref:Amino acid permease-associated region n=1 Tax=Ktedonobacter racemifer DSM 44963 TaxID=485913 RepID=D6TQ63_KTERA|nr:APC family permease [Ktedonobacter racemifer]EFH85711.1 amino acid permease-associated region [Ktedonobacter racemifer DSM 44963]
MSQDTLSEALVPHDEPTTKLRAGRLGLFDALAQSVGLLALEMGIALSISFVAASAGVASPLAYLIAGLASLCLAYVFLQFSRRIAHAGSLYTYITQGLGAGYGFLGGWMYAGAFAVGVSFTLAISSLFTATVLEHLFGITLPWLLPFVVLLLALGACAFFDIRLSTRVVLLLSAVGAGAVLLLALLILRHGRAEGFSLVPLLPSASPGGLSAVFFGVIFAFTSFIGFESSTVLGEETHRAQRVIPRAVMLAIVVGLVFYVLVSYSFVIGYGTTHIDALARDQTPLDTLATRYGGTLFASLLDLVVAISGWTASLAGLTLASRMLFAMARDRRFPFLLSRTHQRHKTPIVAIGVVLGITFLLGLTLGVLLGPFLFYGFLAITASLLILLAYILASLSWVMVSLRNKGTASPLRLVINLLLPVIAIIISAIAAYSSVVPVPAPPLMYAPYIALGWIVLGNLLLLWHHWQHRKTGHALKQSA